MNTAIKLLESHSGRGQILRTIQYASHMASMVKVLSPRTKQGLQTLSGQLSMCRTILRLFDDLPMLSYSLSYGLGSQEKSLLMRTITLLQNLFDQLYYPVEHIAWASKNGILSLPSERWDNFCVYLWFISLSLSIIRDLVSLSRLRLRESKKKDASRSHTAARLSSEELSMMLSIVGNMADLMNCINYFPPGFLWSGKLSTFAVGFFGLISSVIPLWRTIHSLK